MLGDNSLHPGDSRAHGSAIIAVLIPGLFQEGQLTLFQKELEGKSRETFLTTQCTRLRVRDGGRRVKRAPFNIRLARS